MYSEQDITALQTAIASGEKTVEFRSGDRVEYRSVAELQAALRHVQATLAAQSGAPRPILNYLAQSGKGL